MPSRRLPGKNACQTFQTFNPPLAISGRAITNFHVSRVASSCPPPAPSLKISVGGDVEPRQHLGNATLFTLRPNRQGPRPVLAATTHSHLSGPRYLGIDAPAAPTPRLGTVPRQLFVAGGDHGSALVFGHPQYYGFGAFAESPAAKHADADDGPTAGRCGSGER